MHRFVRVLCALAVGSICSLAVPAADAAPADPDVIRITLNPGSSAYLPLYVAIDRGYFAAQHIEIKLTKISGSSLAVLPSLARGDIDIEPVVAGPGLFNAVAQGFAIKLLASIDQSKKGWTDTGCVVVRQDVWDAGSIRKVTDLRGRAVDGGPDGSPMNYMLKRAVQNNGLKLSQLTYTEKFKTTPDMLAALRGKAVDVLTQAEPVCTQMQVEGLAHKWLTFQDVVPRFQGAFYATSAPYLDAHRDAVKRFLMGLLRAERDVTASNGRWTPALVATLAKYSELPEATIAKIPGPTYCGHYGLIDIDALITQERFWAAEGTVQQRISPTLLVDNVSLTEARRSMGVH